MRALRIALVLFGAGFVLSASVAPVSAQATRTWVSGVGDDANPCSRTAPCKTFAGAISKTAANGIINCIDPGGFGAVTITKSITIDCEGTFGGVLATGTNGVNVNGAGINVTLRHLAIEGAGSGLVGINVLNGATVHVEYCHIHGFQSGTAAGIRIAPSVNVEVSVVDTMLAENGTAAGVGAGLLVAPTGAGGARVVVERVQSKNNAIGIFANGTSSTSPIFMSVKDTSMFANSGAGLSAVSSAAGSSIDINVTQSMMSGNAGNGIRSDNARSTVAVGSSMITANNVGVQLANGGRIFSFGNNQVSDNTGGNGAFTSTVPLQ